MGEALKLIEDMISVDLFQARTKARFRGHPKILCCYTQEVFFLRTVLFVQILLQTPECSSGTSQVPAQSLSVTGPAERPEQL
jgi:hypothetical protein